MAYTIKQIEDAIVAALAPLKDAEESLGVLEIKSYQGELEEKDLTKMVGSFPAIYVIYGGSTYVPHGGRKREMLSVTLFVCDRSTRDEAEARRGGPRNPGAYRMLSGCRDLITGKQLGLADLSPFELQADEPVWFGAGISVYAQTYTCAQGHLYPAA